MRIVETESMEQKLQIWREFLQAMRQQGIHELAEDTHNLTAICTRVDAMGLPFTGSNIIAAVNQLGWEKLH